MKKCNMAYCQNKSRANGFCQKHYRQHKLGRVEKWFRSDYSLHPSEPLENAVCIPLTHNLHAIIDVEDYDKVSETKWTACNAGNCHNTQYAKRRNPAKYGGGNGMMHRLVMQYDGLIDHINRNGLDNRKCNLRPCTNSENQMNRQKKKNKRYKGVWNDGECKNWYGRIVLNGKQIYSKPCPDETAAALAYDEMAKKYFGAFALLNFTEGEYI